MKKTLAILILTCVVNILSYGATRTASVSGNFNNTTTWGGLSIPVNGDDIIINTAITVTLQGDFTTSGTFTMNGTATLQMNGFNFNVGSLSAAGNAVINNSGGASDFNCGVNNASTSYTGRFAGNVQLVKRGNGTLTFSAGTSTLLYMDIQNGTLQLTGGTFNLTGSMIHGRALNVNATFTMSGGTVTTASNYVVAGFNGVSNAIMNLSGTSSLNAVGLIIGWNSNNCIVNVSGGTHTFSSHIIHQDAGTGAQLNITGPTTSITSPLIRNYSNGSGVDDLTINLNSGALRTARIGMYSTIASGSHATNLNLNGGTIVATASNNLFEAVSGGGSNQSFLVTLNGVGSTINTAGFICNLQVPIVGGAGGDLTLSGGGTVICSAANTYTEQTVINDATTLRLGASGVIADGASILVNNANAVFDMSGFNETIGSISGIGIIDNVSAGGTPVLTTGGTNATSTFSGIIRNTTGKLGLTKAGTGTFTLSGGNNVTFGGIATVNAGTLVLVDTDNLAKGASTTTFNVASGAVLDLNANTQAIHLGSTVAGGTILAGSGTIRKTGNQFLYLGDQGSSAYAVNINLTGGLIDVQAGTVRNGGWQGTVWTLNKSSLNVAAGATFDVWDGNDVFIDALTGSGNIAIGIGATTVLNVGVNNGSGTFSGTILAGSGNIELVKTGTGTFMLSGANTYTGATTVNGGILQVANNAALGTAAGGTQINAGGTLDINGSNLGQEAFVLNGGAIINNGAGQTQAMERLTVTANSLIGGTGRWDVRNNGLASAGVTINNGVTLTKQGNEQTFFVNIPVVNNGLMVINSGTHNIENNCLTSGTGRYIINASGTLALIAYGAGVNLTNSVTVNNGTLSSYNNAGGNSIISGNVTITGTAKVDNSVDFSISGIISGTGNLTKTNSGTLTLSAINTYTGNTTINAGILELGGVNGNVAGDIINNSSLHLAQTTPTLAYVSSVISGTGTLVSTAVSVGINGNNTYSGLTTINSGKLSLSHNNALGSTASGTVVNNNAILIVYGNTYTFAAEPLTLNNNATFRGSTGNTDIGNWTGPVAITSNNVSIQSHNDDIITISGVISGAFNVTTSGISTIVFSGANTYTGATNITSGILKLGASGVIPDGSAVTVTGTLDMSGFNETVGSIAGTGTINNTTGVGTYTLTIGGNNSNTTYSGLLQNTSGTIALTKIGTGIQTLSGNNTFVGATTVNNGTLRLGNANALGGTGGGTTVAVGATLDLNGQTLAGEPLSLNGTGVGANGAIINSNVTASSASGNISNGNFTVGGTGNITLSGGISSGNVITKIAANTLTLSGTTDNVAVRLIMEAGLTILAKTSSTAPDIHAIGGGGLTINGGTVQLGGTGSDQIYNAADVVINGGIFDLNGRNETVGSIAGAGTIDNVIAGGASTLTFGGNNTTTTFSGIVKNTTGLVNLIKNGTGIQTLSGVNTYSGNTTVNAGTLRAGNGSALGAASAGTQVNNNATFDINGQQLGSEEFVLNGGTMVNNGADQVNAVKKVTVIANSFVGGVARWDVRNLSTSDGYVTINSPYTLTKQDANTIIFVRGTITNNGNIIINNGVISLQTNPTFAGTGVYTVNNSGILNIISFGGPTILTNDVNVNNGAIIGSTDNTGGNSSISGKITLSGSSTINNTVGFGISGVITGTGNYNKTGIGTLTLSGNNTYSGATTVSNGVLRLNSATALGTTGGMTTIVSGGAIDLNGINYSSAEPTAIVGNGYSSSGVIFNSDATAATFAGSVTMTGNSLLNVSNPYTLSGNISGSSFDLVKNGASVLSFLNNTVTINNFTLNAGTLNAGASTINIEDAFTNNGTFTPANSKVRFIGAASQTIPNVNFYDLEINNATGVSLTADIAIGGTIRMTSGILTTGAFTVNLGAFGNINETTPNAQAPTSYITGNVTTIRNLLQNVPNSFGGIGLTLTEANLASNSTSVTRVTGVVSTAVTGNSSIARYFEINPTVDSSLNAVMTFSYFDHEITGHLEDSLIFYKSSDNRATWDGFRPTGLSVATNTLTLSGIADFSFWTLSDINSEPLPITLLSFEVKATKDNYVSISWTTIKEENNDYFTIERSVDGVNWFFVQDVDGSGTTSQKITYSVTDKNPLNGVSYYRLKQTDFDGKFEYFKIVPVEINYEAVKSFECNIYPSPARVENMNMLISSKELGWYDLKITNGVGNILYSTQINHQEESEFIDLSNSLDNYNFGNYYIILVNDKNNSCRQKIVIE